MNKKIAMFCLCTLITTIFIRSVIFAASFDCSKARTEVEKLICGDYDLSKLDESLNEVYLRALNRADIKEQTIESQRQWLKYERDVCQNAECLKKAYETRIKELGLTSSFGIVILRDPSRISSPKAPVKESKQAEIQFGAPILADVQASANLLPLSSSQPPRELATNAEVILISGYAPANKKTSGTTVNVEIDRPGSRVLLVLTSYEKINWHVCASPSTTISGILTWGYETPSVTTTIPTQGFLVRLPYVCETESVNFKDLLNTLNSLFGIEKLDVFRGNYSIPSHVRISALDPPRAELTAKDVLEFKSFIKERKYLDSSREIASPEAGRILMLTEKILLSDQNANEEWHRDWAREFIKYLKQGNGEYLVISPDSFIIYSYFVSAWLSGVYFVDTSTKQLKTLASGYDLEIVEKGIHPDGTHWILCRYGGLTQRRILSGFILITYIDLGRPVCVQSTPLVDEVIAYSEEDPTKISEEYWCGTGENRIEGISGGVLGHRWEDVNNDGQDELIFTVEEKDCNKAGSPIVRIQRVFVISKGSVTAARSNK